MMHAIQGCIQDEIDLGSEGKHREALAETRLPEFTMYLRGKLGAM